MASSTLDYLRNEVDEVLQPIIVQLNRNRPKGKQAILQAIAQLADEMAKASFPTALPAHMAKGT